MGRWLVFGARAHVNVYGKAMAKQFTIEDVRSVLIKQRESNEPEEILAILKHNIGKRFTVHLLRKLPGGEDRWGYDHTASMTHIKDSEYRKLSGGGGISLLLSYNSSGPHVVDPNWIEEKNPAYFSGRRKRNALRESLISNESALHDMALVLTRYAHSKEVLVAAKNELDQLTAYGKPFAPDDSEWERLCGAREEKRR